MDLIFSTVPYFLAGLLIAVVAWHIQDLRYKTQMHEDLIFQLMFPDLAKRHPATRQREEEL